MQTTVTATPTHPGATVAVKDGDDNALTNPVTLTVGDNVIKAVVTAPDAATMKTYMVTVTRGATAMPAIVTDGVQVTSTPMATADTYGLGEPIKITVTFDNAVTVGTLRRHAPDRVLPRRGSDQVGRVQQRFGGHGPGVHLYGAVRRPGRRRHQA